MCSCASIFDRHLLSGITMHLRIWTAIAAALFLLAGPVFAQETSTADKLFRSHDVLEVTISAAFKTLMKERPLEDEFPGTLSYLDDTGAAVELDIELRTRGRYRHQKRTCAFAPIRLNFSNAKAKGTLFGKQNKLKLVTHCRDSDRYEQVTLREYLAYRVLNELTPLSFNVRLLRINYVDTENPKSVRVRYGFIIEHRNRLAKRVKLPHVAIKNTSVGALNGSYTNLTSVFQYFIANTDFSPIAGAPDDFCCHNSNLFGNEGELLYAIPYDFDMAGLTDAPYATPNAKFKIRNVRQRLYRGRCANNEHLPATLQLFRDNRSKLAALIETMPELNGSSKAGMLSLIRKFDKLIDDEKAVEKYLVRRCV
jgi:hypothetical protein